MASTSDFKPIIIRSTPTEPTAPKETGSPTLSNFEPVVVRSTPTEESAPVTTSVIGQRIADMFNKPKLSGGRLVGAAVEGGKDVIRQTAAGTALILQTPAYTPTQAQEMLQQPDTVRLLAARRAGKSVDEFTNYLNAVSVGEIPQDEDLSFIERAQFTDPVQQTAVWLQQQAKRKGLQTKEEYLRSSGWIEDFIRMGPQILSQVGVGLATFGVGNVPLMMAQIGGAEYENLIKQGVPHDRAAAAAMTSAMMQAPLEAIGIGKFTKFIKLKSALGLKLKQLGQAGLTEFLTEWAQQYPSEAAAIWATNPDKSTLDKLLVFVDQLGRITKEGIKEGAIAALWGGLGSASVASVASRSEVIQKENATDVEKVVQATKKKTKTKQPDKPIEQQVAETQVKEALEDEHEKRKLEEKKRKETAKQKATKPAETTPAKPKETETQLDLTATKSEAEKHAEENMAKFKKKAAQGPKIKKQPSVKQDLPKAEAEEPAKAAKAVSELGLDQVDIDLAKAKVASALPGTVPAPAPAVKVVEEIPTVEAPKAPEAPKGVSPKSFNFSDVHTFVVRNNKTGKTVKTQPMPTLSGKDKMTQAWADEAVKRIEEARRKLGLRSGQGDVGVVLPDGTMVKAGDLFAKKFDITPETIQSTKTRKEFKKQEAMAARTEAAVAKRTEGAEKPVEGEGAFMRRHMKKVAGAARAIANQYKGSDADALYGQALEDMTLAYRKGKLRDVKVKHKTKLPTYRIEVQRKDGTWKRWTPRKLMQKLATEGRTGGMGSRRSAAEGVYAVTGYDMEKIPTKGQIDLVEQPTAIESAVKKISKEFTPIEVIGEGEEAKRKASAGEGLSKYEQSQRVNVREEDLKPVTFEGLKLETLKKRREKSAQIEKQREAAQRAELVVEAKKGQLAAARQKKTQEVKAQAERVRKAKMKRAGVRELPPEWKVEPAEQVEKLRALQRKIEALPDKQGQITPGPVTTPLAERRGVVSSEVDYARRMAAGLAESTTVEAAPVVAARSKAELERTQWAMEQAAARQVERERVDNMMEQLAREIDSSYGKESVVTTVQDVVNEQKDNELIDLYTTPQQAVKSVTSILNNKRGSSPEITDVAKALLTVGKQAKSAMQHMMDWLDVESPWKRMGAKRTGLALKNFFSVKTRVQIEGKKEAINLMKILKENIPNPTAEDMADVVLALDDARYANELSADQLMKIRPAMNALEQFFQEAKDVFAARGINYDPLGRMLQEANETLSTENKELKTPEQRQAWIDVAFKAATKLETLQHAKYVSIPFVTLLKNHIRSFRRLNPNSEEYRRAEQFFKAITGKKRNVVNLYDLLAQKNSPIRKTDIDPVSIMLTYQNKVAKDIAMLNVRDAMLKEGVLQEVGTKNKTTGKKSKPSGWKKLGMGYGVLSPHLSPTGKRVVYWADPHALKVLNDLQDVQGKQNLWEKTASLIKMSAFYNPIFLPVYDVFQSAMSGTFLRAARHPLSHTKNLISAFKMVNEQSPEYLDALSAGLYSKPFDFPFNDYKELMQHIKNNRHGSMGMEVAEFIARTKNIRKASVIGALYNLSWNTAWKLDEFVRTYTYLSLKDVGLNISEAAQVAAKFHGDYASVPPKSRRFLNKIFFTPTFKIAMGKVYYQMMSGAVKTMLGKGVKTDQQLALGLAATVGINLAFDALMKSYGYEPDEDEAWWNIGRKYMTKDRTGGRPREFVLTWSNPSNMIQRYLNRFSQASQRYRESGPLGMIHEIVQWDLHPIFKTAMALRTNRTPTGGQIWNPNDDLKEIAIKSAWFAINDLIRLTENANTIIESLAGKDWNDSLTPKQKADLEKRIRRMFVAAPIVVNGPLSILSASLRDSGQVRKAARIKHISNQLKKDMKQYYQQSGKLNKQWLENAKELIKKETVK